MTTTMPQNMQALARANEIRLGRAKLKRDIKSGRLAVTDVIANPPEPALTMPVMDLLCAQYQWARARSLRTLQDVGVMSERRRIGDLTERQRRILVKALSGVTA